MHIKYSVKLELLRHGEPHNQLLSPITQYLGLSGSHEAGTVQVPYEHRHFMTRLKALCCSEDYTPEIRKPKILFAAAEPGGVGTVPFRAKQKEVKLFYGKRHAIL